MLHPCEGIKHRVHWMEQGREQMVRKVWFLKGQPFLTLGHVFIKRTINGAYVQEAPILQPPDAKRLIGKDSDAGKDRGQEEKGEAEDEMVGRHHVLNRHEFEKTLADSEGQGSLECCSPWGRKESKTTGLLNNNIRER